MADVTAYVTEENGHLVLHDPMAEAMVAVIAGHNYGVALQNCQHLYDANLDDIQRFRRRFDEAGYSPNDYCIVVINVDDPVGKQITDIIMPGHDWQAVRNRGLIPIARGITDRKLIQRSVEVFDKQAAEKLIRTEYAAVVITDLVARVYPV